MVASSAGAGHTSPLCHTVEAIELTSERLPPLCGEIERQCGEIERQRGEIEKLTDASQKLKAASESLIDASESDPHACVSPRGTRSREIRGLVSPSIACDTPTDGHESHSHGRDALTNASKSHSPARDSLKEGGNCVRTRTVRVPEASESHRTE
jgi:hypothetical protein